MSEEGRVILILSCALVGLASFLLGYFVRGEMDADKQRESERADRKAGE